MSREIKNLQEESEILKQQVKLLSRLIEVDTLTGLYNRNGFIKRLDILVKDINWHLVHKKERRSFALGDLSLIFIDLDNFKSVNDIYGHKAGDLILRQTAKLLKLNTKSIDILCRWAGDEFVVALPGVAGDEGLRIAKRLRGRLENGYFKLGRKKIKIAASFGVVGASACFKKDKTITTGAIIDYADKAMYAAKNKFGKNSVADYFQIKRKK